MAQKAKLVITFNRDVQPLEDISIFRSKGSLATEMRSVFKGLRTRNTELPITATTLIPGEGAAIAYETYFQVDFNMAGLMTCVRGQNVITLTIDYGWKFSNYTSTAGATFEYFPEVEETFKIAQVAYEPSSTPCNAVKVRVRTTEQADSYSIIGLAGSTPTPVSTNPFYVDVPRTVPTKIQVNKQGHQTSSVEDFIGEPHLYFRRVYQSNVDVRIIPGMFSGATVRIDVSFGNQLSERPEIPPPVLQYSLNGINWTNSNVFSGQVDGDYTAWIKDTLGCVVQKDFVIDGIKTDRSEYISISDLNSIGFAENQVWNNEQNGVSKNPENTLDQTGRQSILNDDRVIYRENDSVRIQFKSNFDYNAVTIEGCTRRNQYIPVVEKMSKNLDVFESLDGKMISYGDGSLTAIYYDDGNVYNMLGGVSGTYELFGNLPDFASLGVQVKIIPQGDGIGGVFPIADILYDSVLGKNILLFDYDCDAYEAVDVITQATFDLLNYEIYEFDLPFSAIFNSFVGSGGAPKPYTFKELFRVKISCTDNIYETREFYSNWVELIEDSEYYDFDNLYSIHYSNNNNRSIFYIYGITHFIRARVEFEHTMIDDSSEVVKGDSSTYLTESVVNHGITIKFEPVTHKVLMKLVLALSSENLFINGLGYVKDGQVETEPIENTNLHDLTCTLIRNTENFNTFANKKVGDSEGYKTVYVPKLITTNLGGSLKV